MAANIMTTLNRTKLEELANSQIATRL